MFSIAPIFCYTVLSYVLMQNLILDFSFKFLGEILSKHWPYNLSSIKYFS